VTEEQLIENIKSDIEATMVGDNLEPLLVYLYAKDDLHDLIMERLNAGDTTAVGVDHTLSNWQDTRIQADLQSSRDIFVNRYEEYRQ
jgi:hypothetical protein